MVRLEQSKADKKLKQVIEGAITMASDAASQAAATGKNWLSKGIKGIWNRVNPMKASGLWTTTAALALAAGVGLAVVSSGGAAAAAAPLTPTFAPAANAGFWGVAGEAAKVTGAHALNGVHYVASSAFYGGIDIAQHADPDKIIGGIEQIGDGLSPSSP